MNRVEEFKQILIKRNYDFMWNGSSCKEKTNFFFSKIIHMTSLLC